MARTILGISIFWLALSMLSDGFAALVVPHRVSTLADPAWAATAIGFITFTGLLAAMLLQPLAGAVSDAINPRWGRRPMLLAGVASMLLALAAFALADSISGLLIAFVLLMLSMSIAQAAQQGFIPDLVRSPWRGRAAGAKGLADVGGASIAFLLLGGLLAGPDVWPAIAVVATVVVTTALLTVALIREPRAKQLAPSRLPRPSLLSPYSLDRERDVPFLRAVVARFLYLLGVFAVGRFFLLFVAERLGLDASAAAVTAGGLLGALTLASALSALPAGWLADRVGRGSTMLAGSVLSCVGLLLLFGAWSADGILLGGGLLAIGSALFSSANWALTADLAPREEAARFLAIANFGTAGAAAAAGLLGPVVDIGRAILPDIGHGAILLLAILPVALSAFAARPFLRMPVATSGPSLEEASAS